ncbi:Armadillo [Artemisia annua]|uniref:Armadillo n=1 Tax=Artemisia annua TaxID=35608 RepID=A0A2U1NJ97_ARTAN|nr:Armadillo [Artemisia annua]
MGHLGSILSCKAHFCVVVQGGLCPYSHFGEFQVFCEPRLIDDAEGLKKIENLQSHDSYEIFENVKILETYWLEEEDEAVVDGSQTGFNFSGNNVQVPYGGFNFNS